MKPERHVKSWGFEDWIENGEYCGKWLSFRAGGQTSYHWHKEKLETMFLFSGRMLIRLENETIPLAPGDKIQIQRGQRHQLIAVENSDLFECSTHHEDSDSYRESN